MIVATVVAPPGRVSVVAAVVVALLMVALWALSIRLRDVSIIDPAWGPAFVLVAATGAVIGGGCPGRRWLLLILTAIWGLRLGLHLLARKLSDPSEDHRYAAMRERRGSAFVPWSLVWIFGLQGLLVLVVSLPLQVAAEQGGRLGWVVVPGVALWATGFVFEVVGDEQLRRFRARPSSAGQVMDEGLWRYTRHPNYFGDCCVWWGLWLVALTASGVWWTAIGPIVMTVLLVRVSGAARLERDIGDRRPQYAEYVRRTSGFVPRPRRRR